MASIFLSYAREDRRFAERLARVLESAGHSVWWDRHLSTGREFAGEIETELAKAELVLVAWSEAAARSPWVRDEAAIGRDRGRLLPVLADRSQPPIGFRQLQALDLAGWKGRATDRRTKALVDAVEKVIRGVAYDLPPARAAWHKQRRLRVLAAALTLAIVATLGLYFFNSNRAEAQPASIAVLPFKNITAGDPYFAEGVAEEIANQLSREPQFKVAGRTSSELFKDAADVRDVGRRLHVAYVLEGSVRSAGQQVRVEVALVDAKAGMRLWSQDFRGNLNDIFGIQDSIGQEIAGRLRKQLVRQAPIPGTTTTRGDVYSLYVTARSLMKLREPAKIAAAADLLKQAVRLDPNYAPAWAELALATQLGQFYGHEDDREFRRSDKGQLDYVKRALALAPELGEAHAIYGLILGGDTLEPARLQRSRAELEKAVTLNPNDALAWYWLSEQRLDALDFEGALSAIRRTATIDPFFVFSEKYAIQSWRLGDRGDARRFLSDRIANHPDPFVREFAADLAAQLQNDLAAAYRHAQLASEIGSTDQKPIAQQDMGGILMLLGLFDEAERFVPRFVVELHRGKPPAQAPPPTMQEALDFWLMEDQDPRFMPRTLVMHGQSGHLVRAYDLVFSSPENMASRYWNLTFVEFAPTLAIALQQAGRHGDGVRFLILADKMCSGAFRRGRTPPEFRVRCSRVRALMGRKEDAIALLEQAYRDGWRPMDGEFAQAADEPGFVLIRNDPGVKRIDGMIAAERERERRELVAAGI